MKSAKMSPEATTQGRCCVTQITIRYFAGPKDDFTWNAIVEGLSLHEDSILTVECGDGQERRLLELTFQQYDMVRESTRTNQEFRTRFWRKVGDGQIVPWPWEEGREQRLATDDVEATSRRSRVEALQRILQSNRLVLGDVPGSP